MVCVREHTIQEIVLLTMKTNTNAQTVMGIIWRPAKHVMFTRTSQAVGSLKRATDSSNGFSSNRRASTHTNERGRQSTSGKANTPRRSGAWNFGNQSPKSKSSEEGDFSFSSVWDEIKFFFSNMNLGKTMNIVKSTIDHFKKSKDVISKITCVIEGIIEIFN